MNLSIGLFENKKILDDRKIKQKNINAILFLLVLVSFSLSAAYRASYFDRGKNDRLVYKLIDKKIFEKYEIAWPQGLDTGQIIRSTELFPVFFSDQNTQIDRPLYMLSGFVIGRAIYNISGYMIELTPPPVTWDASKYHKYYQYNYGIQDNSGKYFKEAQSKDYYVKCMVWGLLLTNITILLFTAIFGFKLLVTYFSHYETLFILILMFTSNKFLAHASEINMVITHPAIATISIYYFLKYVQDVNWLKFVKLCLVAGTLTLYKLPAAAAIGTITLFGIYKKEFSKVLLGLLIASLPWMLFYAMLSIMGIKSYSYAATYPGLDWLYTPGLWDLKIWNPIAKYIYLTFKTFFQCFGLLMGALFFIGFIETYRKRLNEGIWILFSFVYYFVFFLVTDYTAPHVPLELAIVVYGIGGSLIFRVLSLPAFQNKIQAKYSAPFYILLTYVYNANTGIN